MGQRKERPKNRRGLLQVYYRKRMKNNRLRTGTNGAFSLLSNLGFIFAIVWSGVRIMRGDSDFGSLFSIVLLLGELQYPLTSFSSVLPVYYARAASGERLAEIDAAPAETYANKTEPDNSPLNKIRIDNLSFGYGRGQIFSDATSRNPRREPSSASRGNPERAKVRFSNFFCTSIRRLPERSGCISEKSRKSVAGISPKATELQCLLMLPQGKFFSFPVPYAKIWPIFLPKKDCGRTRRENAKSALRRLCGICL